MTRITSTMTWNPWKPEPYAAADGPQLMHGVVANHYRGELEAEGEQQCLITLFPGGLSLFAALERVTGTVAGRTGSFVLELSGGTAGGAAKAELKIVEGSGTGALSGIRGSGVYHCDNPGPHGHASVTLECSFD